MFGDAYPHEFEDFMDIMKNYPHVQQQLDWRDEADQLLSMVSVQASITPPTGQVEVCACMGIVGS